MSAGRTRSYAQRVVSADQEAIFWHALDLTRRIYGQPKQLGALTLTLYCYHFQSCALSDCAGCV